RHLAGGQLRDRLHVAAVFVAEGEVREEILHRAESLGLEHRGPAGTDALDIGQRSGEVHENRLRLNIHHPTSGTIAGVKLFAAVLTTSLLAARADLRLGIIGTDTSHVIAFTKILNDASAPDHVDGARVVAAYKGGSKDVESSATRVDKFADELKTKWKIEFTPDIASLCRKVDAVLIESVDARTHME